MDPAKRIITQLPLRELWDMCGPVAATRERALAPADIPVFLRVNPMPPSRRFAVAELGRPLQWLDYDSMLVFWRESARGRIVDPAQHAFPLEDFPGEFCYSASEWHVEGAETPILLFERHD